MTRYPALSARPLRACCAALVLGAGLGVGAGVPSVAQEGTYGPVDDAPVEIMAETPENIPDPLAEAAQRALDQSPLVMARLAELAALEADLNSTERLRYPNLSAEILATTGGSNVADADGLAVNLALEQPIWAGGAIGNQIDAARGERDVGATSVREARFNLLLAVIDAWYEALLSYERVRALDEGLVEYNRLVLSIERRVAQQVSPYADLTLAQSRLTQLEVQRMTAQERGDAAMLRLTELVGMEVPAPVLPDMEIAEGLPPEPVAVDELMACSPALARMRGQIDVAEARARTARSNLFPQVLLQLSQNEITGARAALVLRAQTGNGLNLLTQVDSAEARVDAAVAELGQTDREVRRLVRAEYVTLRAGQLRIEAGELASQAASDLLASYQRQFVAGRRSWLDVLNAAREVTDAQVTESDARVLTAASATRILAYSCRWRPVGV